MPITWTHEVDAAIDAARRDRKPVLVDFTAAPM